MTAHDDDQELVTIRIPRRAAALYAAELDVTSGPVFTKVAVFSQLGFGAVCLCIGLAIIIGALVRAQSDDLPTTAIFLVGGVLATAIGAILSLVAFSFYNSTKRRGLL